MCSSAFPIVLHDPDGKVSEAAQAWICHWIHRPCLSNGDKTNTIQRQQDSKDLPIYIARQRWGSDAIDHGHRHSCPAPWAQIASPSPLPTWVVSMYNISLVRPRDLVLQVAKTLRLISRQDVISKPSLECKTIMQVLELRSTNKTIRFSSVYLIGKAAGRQK